MEKIIKSEKNAFFETRQEALNYAKTQGYKVLEDIVTFECCFSEKELTRHDINKGDDIQALLCEDGEEEILLGFFGLREIAAKKIKDFEDDAINEWIVWIHTVENSMIIEVCPDGDIMEIEVLGGNIRHSDYECLYKFEGSSSCCDCDVCALYRDYEDYKDGVEDEETFEKRWGKGSLEFVENTSLENAIIENANDNGFYADDVRDSMLEALYKIPYGYFDDEF